jgi:LDH2 family malate/lactate/ureidoglycolate dehydrogenase
VTVAAAERLCRTALERAGAPATVAARVARALVANEQRGLTSHGMLRLGDYLAELAAGTLRATATPSVRSPSPLVRVVDGERGFGVLAADAVADQICDVLAEHELAAVSLLNANHIGALGDIGRAVAGRGAIVLGFVNYLGHGQRVAPWKRAPGRLCTNPMLIAVPSESGPDFVLDMSTSTVAEGKVRARLRAGDAIPPGWLVDEQWRPVTEPGRLYSEPPSAFMTPLGGPEGHKGFGLALAVELLAGVITGGGFAADPAPTGGNAGLFIGVRPTLAGRSSSALAEDVAALRRHTTGMAERGSTVRWPGDGGARAASATLRVQLSVWREVERAAGPARRDEER